VGWNSDGPGARLQSPFAASLELWVRIDVKSNGRRAAATTSIIPYSRVLADFLQLRCTSPWSIASQDMLDPPQPPCAGHRISICGSLKHVVTFDGSHAVHDASASRMSSVELTQVQCRRGLCPNNLGISPTDFARLVDHRATVSSLLRAEAVNCVCYRSIRWSLTCVPFRMYGSCAPTPFVRDDLRTIGQLGKSSWLVMEPREEPYTLPLEGPRHQLLPDAHIVYRAEGQQRSFTTISVPVALPEAKFNRPPISQKHISPSATVLQHGFGSATKQMRLNAPEPIRSWKHPKR
jgi:hypothetical protein